MSAGMFPGIVHNPVQRSADSKRCFAELLANLFSETAAAKVMG